jgi:hypothetical protein
MTTQTFTDTLVVVSCGADGCDITFGMTERYHDARVNDHKTWYCPNGHPRVYNGRSEVERLRTQLKYTRESETFYRDQAALERRRAAAQKGQRTRVLNLIAKGVCPVRGCRRNFGNVREHMQTEHPDFHGHGES